MSKQKILLVEDDNLLRIGLKSMVEMDDNYTIEHASASGKDAIDVFSKKQFELVLLDLGLPDISGIDVLRRMKSMSPETPIIILTVCEENKLIYESLEYGATAYVLKGSGPEELFLGIKYALNKELFISPKLARLIVDDYLFVNRQRNALPPLHALTAREKEIVKLIIDGKKSKEIADILFISVKTVDKHRSNILSKLGLTNLIELRQRSIYILQGMNA